MPSKRYVGQVQFDKVFSNLTKPLTTSTRQVQFDKVFSNLTKPLTTSTRQLADTYMRRNQPIGQTTRQAIGFSQVYTKFTK